MDFFLYLCALNCENYKTMANILSLKVENFRSYKNKTTFSFEAVDTPQMEGNYHVVELNNGSKVRLLNSAVIYGANAAGKSNVIIAFAAISAFVKISKRYDPEDVLTYEPYMFSSETRKDPIAFWIQFIVDGEIYEYHFAYTDQLFLTETLERKSDNVLILDRKADGRAYFNHDILPDVQDDAYLLNHLALSELSLKAIPLIQSIYRELASIKVYQLSEGYNRYAYTDGIARMLHDDPDGMLTKTMKDLMSSADTGISDVIVKEEDEESYVITPDGERIKIPKRYKLAMLHPTEDGDKIELFAEQESTGTRTLVGAGARLFKALQRGEMVAYDEMNNALHPMLFRRLVELFNNKETNPNNAQLIVTTHDTVLIDDVLLRADQIWFVEKMNGVSDLYSAIDFDGVSIDQPFGPWYRAGRLGGRPRLQPYTLPYVGQQEGKEK